MSYLDPFTYLLGGLLGISEPSYPLCKLTGPVFPIWNVEVRCKQEEYGIFDPPSGQTCGNYMSSFIAQGTGYINNPVRPPHICSTAKWLMRFRTRPVGASIVYTPRATSIYEA